MAKWTCDCGMVNTTEFCVACGKKYQGTADIAWVCSCGQSNTGRFCVACGQQRTAGSDKWLCDCGAENSGKFCVQCGKKRAEANISAENAQEAGKLEVKADVAGAVETEVSVSDVKSPEKNTPETDMPGANVYDVNVAEDSGINMESQNNFQHDSFASSVKNADESVVFHTETTGTVRTSNKKINPKAAFLFAVVLLIVAAYFGYGKYLEYRYDNNCSEYIAVMDNVNNTMQDVGNLSGDTTEEARQKSIDSLNADMEKLKKINEFFAGGNVPEDRKVNQKKLADLTTQNITYLEKALGIINYDNMIYGPTHTRHAKEFVEICDGFSSSEKELLQFLADNEDLIIQTRSAYDLFNPEGISDNIKKYCTNKLKHDKDKVAEDSKKYAAKAKAANDELMIKNEVVFLTSNVIKTSNDSLDIIGAFRNGTQEIISGIQDMQVDVILKNGDEEVLSIKDYQYNAPELSGLLLIPGGISQCGITIPADVQDKEYDNYEVNVHKIKWKVRRLVKK